MLQTIVLGIICLIDLEILSRIPIKNLVSIDITNVFVWTLFQIAKLFELRIIQIASYLGLSCLVEPLREEIMFRYYFKNMFEHIGGSYLINSIVFSIFQTNLLAQDSSNLALYKFFSRAYVGYYLIQIDNVFNQFVIHSLLNGVLVLYAYYKIKSSGLNSNSTTS